MWTYCNGLVLFTNKPCKGKGEVTCSTIFHTNANNFQRVSLCATVASAIKIVYSIKSQYVKRFLEERANLMMINTCTVNWSISSTQKGLAIICGIIKRDSCHSMTILEIVFVPQLAEWVHNIIPGWTDEGWYIIITIQIVVDFVLTISCIVACLEKNRMGKDECALLKMFKIKWVCSKQGIGISLVEWTLWS